MVSESKSYTSRNVESVPYVTDFVFRFEIQKQLFGKIIIDSGADIKTKFAVGDATASLRFDTNWEEVFL